MNGYKQRILKQIWQFGKFRIKIPFVCVSSVTNYIRGLLVLSFVFLYSQRNFQGRDINSEKNPSWCVGFFPELMSLPWKFLWKFLWIFPYNFSIHSVLFYVYRIKFVLQADILNHHCDYDVGILYKRKHLNGVSISACGTLGLGEAFVSGESCIGMTFMDMFEAFCREYGDYKIYVALKQRN